MTNLHTPRRIWAMIALAAISLMAAQAHGETDKYPSRPITVVVPYTPGGSVDTVARLVTAQLQEQLGQPIVIENKPGASGMIGSEYVARAKPDGYTLLLHASSQVYLPLVDARVKYDALKDFTPIARLGTVPLLVVTGAESPFNTLKELQAQAHAKKDSLTWATSGYGTSSHLVEEMLNRDLKLGMQIVPYRGAAPQLTDVTAGHVSAAASPMPGAYPYVASGKLKALAVTSSSRVAKLPNVPTVAESGVEGFDFSSWYGVWGPAGLPANIANQLATEINKAIHAPEVTKVFDTMMFEVAKTSPQDLAKVQQDEHDKISLLAKEADIAVK
ncbi:Bug family tripartite tricarboxylate transporter substrate binding protein [Bordetella genomosp. 4]|uniref:Bug family tripartite tricarboxylate transporter substrate binding protein n=1 Tax=Bordetella genomosp. 4 TaxID=463044 RepID=UPI000B9EDA17|nr:tripartite tricarboxylate transporter substrate binding protein [Bordetella genomosp. 4]OZI43129.1 ABC transporter substrate-binding protein [Bordetella genomosp. 4]